jgi:hypothetical protein
LVLFSLERLRLFLGLISLSLLFRFVSDRCASNYRMPVRMLGVQRRSTIYMYNARRSFSENFGSTAVNRHLEIDNSNDFRKTT